ncbi:hypothetical protein FQR65_LT04752 [Abscondita terminalis]|nr:hypothetical protein FQR65_LT04752 [Abscondita terminalis]
MAEQDIDWSKLPDDVREKLAELDLELSEAYPKSQQSIENRGSRFRNRGSRSEIEAVDQKSRQSIGNYYSYLKIH